MAEWPCCHDPLRFSPSRFDSSLPLPSFLFSPFCPARLIQNTWSFSKPSGLLGPCSMTLALPCPGREPCLCRARHRVHASRRVALPLPCRVKLGLCSMAFALPCLTRHRVAWACLARSCLGFAQWHWRCLALLGIACMHCSSVYRGQYACRMPCLMSQP